MTRRWDVVIVGRHPRRRRGAGRRGAGHSALVLEQSTIAAGSSSRSSKLIHGGLRYLESASCASCARACTNAV